jgi:hypothetical protein
MSKSFEPRFLCSKIHSSPHSCISKFYAIFWDFSQIFLPPKSFYSNSNPIFNPENQLKLILFYSFGFQPEKQIRPGLLSFVFQPSRGPSPPSLPAQAAWPTVPHPSPQAGPSLSARASLAYSRKYVFLFETRLPSVPPSLSSLADMWTPHVSSFFSTAPAATPAASPPPRLARAPPGAPSSPGNGAAPSLPAAPSFPLPSVPIQSRNRRPH